MSRPRQAPVAQSAARTSVGAALQGLAMLLAGIAVGCGPDNYEDVLLIGHRGSPLLAPENSIQGFQTAYAQGADGIELDVQLTRDDRNVVMHDETLDRTTSCTGPVRSYSVEELRGCILTHSYDEPVIPLDEALEAVGHLFQIVFLEIKVPEQTPLAPEDIVTQVDDAVAVVLRLGLADRVVLISYDATALVRIAARQIDGVRGGWDDFTTESVSNANRYDLPWVLMPIRTVEPWVGDIVTGLDRKLAVYQVVNQTDFAAAVDARAHAIMADSLTTLASMLGRKPRDLPPQ